jgi:hypothetical protein
MEKRFCVIFALCTLLIFSEVHGQVLVNFFQRPNKEHLFSSIKILQNKINCSTPFFPTKKPDPSKSKKSKRGPTPVPPPTPSKIVYTIGEYAQGGVVIWVTEDKQHGLVVSIKNNSTKAIWGPRNPVTHATNNQDLPAFYTNPIPRENYGGYQNQKTIQALQNWETNYQAFNIAFEYKERVGSVEYDDWFLPTLTELQQIYLNRNIVSSVSKTYGGDDLSTLVFWSSREAEDSSTHAWYLNFFDGTQDDYTKDDPFAVRCVRAF